MGISNRTAGVVSGTALIIHGLLKRGPLGAIAVGAGGVIAYFAFRNPREVAPIGRQVLRASHTLAMEPYEAFLHWKDLSQLPTLFSALGAVKQLDNGNWRIGLPGVAQLEVALTNEQPGHVLEWRSVEGGAVQGHGMIRFTRKKNGRGTKVHHEISYGSATQKASPAGVSEPSLQKA